MLVISKLRFDFQNLQIKANVIHQNSLNDCEEVTAISNAILM